MKQIKCRICGKMFSKKRHLVLHNISEKDYYDKYIKKPDEGFCIYCKNEASFISMWKGYRNTCGYSCAGHLREQNRTEENIKISNEKRKKSYIQHYGTEHCMQSNECKQKLIDTNMKKYGVPSVFNTGCVIRQKAEQTMKDRYGGVGYGSNKKYDMKKTAINRGKSHALNVINAEKRLNATTQTHLVEKYGQGFLTADILTDDMIIFDDVTGSKFIKNEYIPMIEKYSNGSRSVNTKSERKIIKSIQSYYNGEIKNNTRKIIYPKELDIYLPELKIGIEYNGLYRHSTLNCAKDYHLNKSLLCREKGIRLIHIYEFEDLNEQLELLKSLILGEDKYPKDDFNKNNLLNDIPIPEIIYQDKKFTIYGAGKLY